MARYTAIEDAAPRRSGGRYVAIDEAQAQPYEGWGDYLKDAARTAGQGLGMGFSDEAIAAVRAALTDATYDQALGEERAAVRRFRQTNPATALGLEVAAGVAVPVVGGIKAAATLPGRVVQGSKIGTGYGAAAGYGAGEGPADGTWLEGAVERVKSAGYGAVAGAGVGAAVPAGVHLVKGALGKGSTLAAQASDHQEAARLYLADRLRAAGLDEHQIAQELERGRAAADFGTRGRADLPETIADVSPTSQRVLRGIKVGGDADEVIEPFLAHRQSGNIDFARGAESGGQFSRLNEDLRLALRSPQEALPDTLERIGSKRSESARLQYREAWRSQEPFDVDGVITGARLEAQQLVDPAQRRLLNRATRYFSPRQQATRDGDLVMPAVTLERFDKAKQAIDDMRSSQAVKEQRNLYRLLTNLKHDMLDAVHRYDADGIATRNVAYQAARDSFASRSALLNAAELGRGFARGTDEVTPRMWRALSEPEKAMFRSAWRRATMRKAGGKAQGPTSDFTGPFRSENVADDLRMMLPPQAGKTPEFPGGNREKLGELVTREQRMSQTANKVLGNSQTAEKTIDSIDIGRMARVLRYVKDQGGAINAAAAGLSDVLEKMGAVKGERAKYLAGKLLSIDPQEQQQFLQEVANTYGTRRALRVRKALEDWMVQIESSASQTAGRRVGEPTERERAIYLEIARKLETAGR